MLIVTHEMGFAREVASRAVFLADGRIEEEGPPAQVFGDPRDGTVPAVRAAASGPRDGAIAARSATPDPAATPRQQARRFQGDFRSTMSHLANGMPRCSTQSKRHDIQKI